jgi:hypothetical protein
MQICQFTHDIQEDQTFLSPEFPAVIIDYGSILSGTVNPTISFWCWCIYFGGFSD